MDADIVVDGSFVRSLNQDYRNLVLQNQSQPTSLLSHLIGNNNLCNNGLTTEAESNSSPLSNLATAYDLCYGIEAANQFELGSMALSLFRNIMPSSDQMQDYIHQYLRLVIAHEVGHTLGLRHNFHGSTLLKPEEMNNTQITRTKGLTASVMDYIPPILHLKA